MLTQSIWQAWKRPFALALFAVASRWDSIFDSFAEVSPVPLLRFVVFLHWFECVTGVEGRRKCDGRKLAGGRTFRGTTLDALWRRSFHDDPMSSACSTYSMKSNESTSSGTHRGGIVSNKVDIKTKQFVERFVGERSASCTWCSQISAGGHYFHVRLAMV